MEKTASIEKALESILDAVMPQSINWEDIKDHLTGYNRRKAKEKILQDAMRDLLTTKIKLWVIYTELQQLQDNGGIL